MGTGNYACICGLTIIYVFVFKPFHATGLFISPEGIKKPDVFRGYRKRQMAWNELSVKIQTYA